MSSLPPFVDFLAIDPSLGRLDYHSLSDQALMEMLVDGMRENNQMYFKDENGNFRDVCEWGTAYRNFTKCFDDRVTEIRLYSFSFSEKQFPFQFIPPLVHRLYMNHCAVYGSLDTSDLPRGLREIAVMNGRLSGAIICKGFPRGVEKICIANNFFTGSIVLSDLPAALVEFHAQENNFSGEVNFNDLPRGMQILNLTDNEFTGEIAIKSLSDTIQVVNISGNDFHGDFRLEVYPPDLQRIRLGQNYRNIARDSLSGTVVLRKASGEMGFKIWFPKIEAVVDDEGKKHAWAPEILQTNTVENVYFMSDGESEDEDS